MAMKKAAAKKASALKYTPTRRVTLANPSGLIDAYEIFYSSNGFSPRIALKRKGQYIATLVFRPNVTALPPDALQNGQAMMFYHQEDFHNIIDVLRNEKPVQLVFLGTGSGFENHLRTIRA